MKFIITLFIFQLLAIIVAPSDVDDCRRCPPNSRYTKCGTQCPLKCSNLKPINPCILSCRVGCECLDGYALDDDNRCVAIKDCPNPGCGGRPNEEYRTGLSSSCDIPTCDNNHIIEKRPDICTKDYVSTCVCINKTVRNPVNQQCIPPSACPKSKANA